MRMGRNTGFARSRRGQGKPQPRAHHRRHYRGPRGPRSARRTLRRSTRPRAHARAPRRPPDRSPAACPSLSDRGPRRGDRRTRRLNSLKARRPAGEPLSIARKGPRRAWATTRPAAHPHRAHPGRSDPLTRCRPTAEPHDEHRRHRPPRVNQRQTAPGATATTACLPAADSRSRSTHRPRRRSRHLARKSHQAASMLKVMGSKRPSQGAAHTV